MRSSALLRLLAALAALVTLATAATAFEQPGPIAHAKTIYDGIERVYGLSDDEFYDNYFHKQKPVILMDAIKDWKAHSEWTLEKLRARFSHAEVEVQMNRASTARFEEEKMKHRRKIPFSEFVDMVAKSQDNPTNDFYLTALNRVTDNQDFAPLLQDAAPLGNIINWPPPAGSHNFWLGPKGTVTPMHFDPPSLVHPHVHGRKRWYLVDSREAPNMCVYESWFSRFSPIRPDYELCPTSRDVTVLEAVLGPGETLFVPSGWFHFVEGLEIAATISFTSFTRPARTPNHNGHPHLKERHSGQPQSAQVELSSLSPNPVEIRWNDKTVVCSLQQPGAQETIGSWSDHWFVAETVNSTGWRVQRRWQVPKASGDSRDKLGWLVSGEWQDQEPELSEAQQLRGSRFGTWHSAERLPEGTAFQTVAQLDDKVRAGTEQARRGLLPQERKQPAAAVANPYGGGAETKPMEPTEPSLIGSVLSWLSGKVTNGKQDL